MQSPEEERGWIGSAGDGTLAACCGSPALSPPTVEQ